ncbi:hypothetical protein [Stenotrophomonas pictorum]|uniref:hypothetical protein n=1 Tax=Stenotrophomonas pictorum TaxID=86184 RepID=UPI000A7BD4D2|nr:hypothetical protein [Stenotrophomonas pictorum]
MYDLDRSIPANDHDATLLEGLFQLAVAGETEGWQFDRIDTEVYSRLLTTYNA